MKKTFYAAMLLLGFGIFLTACNNSGTSKDDSQANASVEKEWIKEMEAKGHIFFKIQYGPLSSNLNYLLMMPYAFSKDGTRGVLYHVYSGNIYEQVGLCWYAQYEVNGEYLLLTDIVDLEYGHKHYPRVMKIEHNNDRFVLTGRYPRYVRNNLNPVESFYQEVAPSDCEYYICLVEDGRYCMHK